MPQKSEWSVSALKTIGTCGRQYHYKYRSGHDFGEETAPLAFGSVVHKVIERVHKESKWDPSDWQRLWAEVWAEYTDNVDFAGYQKNAFNKLGLTMVSNYIEADHPGEVLEIEYKFPDTKGEAYKIGKHTIKGIIDQVRRLPDGRILVLDLKTSKEKPDQLLLDADPQFTFYWWVVKNRYGQDPDLAWLHLRTGELIHTSRTEKDLEVVQAMLDEGSLRVKQEMFARNIGYHCKYCTFMNHCLSTIRE